MKKALPMENLIRVLVVCSASLFANSVCADSWGPPREFDTLSENGKFVARVIPGKKDSRPVLIISAVDNAKTNEIWKAELSNHVSPTRVYVSDDGNYVVTLDNYFGVGYGDDVVAIYGRRGQLTKFSLEQIAPLPKPKPDAPAWLSDRHAYEGKFSHSTASRHWREKSIEFFFKHAGQPLFCLWLDWENRWVVWRLSDGQMIKITSEQAKALDIEGRRWSLGQVKSDRFASAALNFLSRLRFKEDRPLIEAWLRDTEFSGGSMQSSSSENTKVLFAFTARSHKRETADQILARWDGKDSDNTGLGSSDNYQFLGTLKCSVAFTAAPAKKEGTIRVYLIPESIPLKEWASERPAQYLIADLNYSYPYVFEDDRGRDGSLSDLVSFIIYGVTPGRYRLKAVWDKTAPFEKKDEIVCRPRLGDYESATSPVISIRKGSATEGAKIECTKLVE